MQLLVIRHAIADDRETFARTGRSDDLRPLTEEGRDKMRRAAGGLRTIAPGVAILGTSPLVRARETAEIVAPAVGVKRVETVEALRPERRYEELVDWLLVRSPQAGSGAIAVVGHEPHLSGLVTWLMTGGSDSRLELKKGGACLLEFSKPPSAGEAMLLWLLTPSQLRRLAE
jgi:phosphohistidine phosphatase